VKTFEFVDLTTRIDTEHAYFFVPALRSIVEDVILFGFLSEHPQEERELVIANLMQLRVAERVKNQSEFFERFRQFQPVLPMYKVDEQSLRDELQAFWNQNGWPKLKREMPPVRQIAEKWNKGVLQVVYDFIYRVTSDSVHSNPRSLLRQGWGKEPPEDNRTLRSVRFSTTNMGVHHANTCQTYGTYMLCLFLELFDDELALIQNQEEQDASAELREFIWTISRWPEAVTFEEMNIEGPEYPTERTIFAQAAYGTLMKIEGLIGGTNILMGGE